jgi:hypothetical protein
MQERIKRMAVWTFSGCFAAVESTRKPFPLSPVYRTFVSPS